MNKRIQKKKLWRISWRSKLTGFRGHGSAGFRIGIAKAICHQANQDHPELHHRPELLGAKGRP